MKPRLCIAIYDISQFAGDHSAAVSLLLALRETYDVSLLSITSFGPPAYEIPEDIPVTVLLPPVRAIRDAAVRGFFPALRYFRQQRFDVAVLARNYTGFVLGPLQPFLTTKLIYWEHGALMSQWNEWNVRMMRRVASRRCRRTVVLTDQTRNDYMEKLRVPAEKILRIYNWIQLSSPASGAYDASSRRIVSVGRFGVEKGFDLLVTAFSAVAARHPDWELDLYGDGEMMPTVRQLVARLGLEERVHLMGMRRDVGALYRQYAMYVLPSHREGLPLVLLEAKANRLPIVAFDVMTGPREIVRHETDGLLVPPEDTDALAAAMCRLIEDEPLRRQMAERTQEDLARFSRETILTQWRTLIDSLIEEE